MTTTRLWIIAGIAAFVAVAIGVAAAIVAPSLPQTSSSTAPTPAASASPEPSSDATTRPSPAPTPSSTATAFSPTCDNTATAAFVAQMEAQGQTPLDLSADAAAPRPFDGFLDGTPEITVACRWGAAPAETFDLAWTILASEAVADFVQHRVEAGAVLSEVPEGRVLEVAGGGAYLFTESDARWSTSRANLAHIKAPHEER